MHRARGGSLALAALAGTAVLGVSWGASGSLMVPHEGGDVHVSEVRVAFASSPSRTVTWEQLLLDETRGELVWLIEVPKGGWIEGADAGWFSALDAVSAPVIAPAKTLGCGAASRESTAWPAPVNPPRAVDRSLGVMSGSAALDRLLADRYLVDATVKARLETLDAAGLEVALLHLPPGAIGETRVVRVLGPTSRGLPTILMPGGNPKLRTWTFYETRARPIGLLEIEPAFDRLAWSGGGSNYPALLSEATSKAPGGVVTSFASLDAILSDQPLGIATLTLPSLVRTYFHADETASTDVWTCAKRAASYAASPKVVAATCPRPPPWTSDLTVPACVAAPAESIPSADFACGTRDDLAAAMGGSTPSRWWLTRFEATANAFSEDRGIEDARRGSLPAFHEAKALGDKGCGSVGSEPTPITPDPPPSTTEDPNDLPRPESPQAAVHDGCALAEVLAGGCGGSSSSSSSSDSCSGDSRQPSGSGSSSSDSCDSDSKSGSSSSSDSCDSGSSNSSDDGCGGGSSSGSGGSSGCDGGGSGGGGGGSGCRIAQGRKPIRLSPLAYLLVAVGAVTRRLGRRRSKLAPEQ